MRAFLTLPLVLATACNYAIPHAREATAPISANIQIMEGFDLGWRATGFYFATKGEYSVVATAGHVCKDSDAELLGIPKPVYQIDGHDAYVIYDHDVAPEDDVCLLLVEARAPAVLSPGEQPDEGDEILYVGYPNGTRGTYRGLVEQVTDGGTLLSIPGYFGASGSAIVDSRGYVVGILSMGDMEFPHHVYATTLDAVKRARAYADAFLRRLHVKPLDTLRDAGILVEKQTDFGASSGPESPGEE